MYPCLLLVFSLILFTKILGFPIPKISDDRSDKPWPIISGILPPALTSSRIVGGLCSNEESAFPERSQIILSLIFKIISSPLFNPETSHSIGKAPESSAVLKKIGAILFPKTYPPVCLFGINGISFPMCHCKELIADFLDEPVPTTSPTYTKGFPNFLRSSINPKPSGILLMSIDWACKGISARDHAFCAGDKSSVLVSPSTLNTVSLISLCNSFLLLNQSALAQDSSNFVANLFPDLCFSTTS